MFKLEGKFSKSSPAKSYEKFKDSLSPYLSYLKNLNPTVFSYVPNPIKVLGEIKARGGDIETVEGEVVAGDAGDIDVISMKGNVSLILFNVRRC